jgi:hypothetical protein
MQTTSMSLRHGFVSFHPEPEGIVHLIGGYFFGTAANFWYRELIQQLQRRFTVHVYSYSFAQLSHWRLTSDLLEQIELVKREGVRLTGEMRYGAEVYSNPSQHCLVGHSLGCECIALIRFLGFSKERQLQLLQQAQDVLGPQIVTRQDWIDVESLPQKQPVPYAASLLMAPCFQTPTTIDWLLDVRPQQQLMRFLIQQAPELLPLTSLISFDHDTIAGPDAVWIHQALGQQKSLVEFQCIEVNHWWWTALQYHMIPAFDPSRSGLAETAIGFIQALVQPTTLTETLSLNAGLP